MIKSFLITISFSILLFSSQQILFVVADDFNSSVAKMECYEGEELLCEAIEVNLGKNGLGWGVGEMNFSYKADEPHKKEGDKRAPAGLFHLTDIFGYAPSHNYSLPYLYASKNLICVDDSNSNFYNQIIEANGDEKSFEHMRRSDNLYEIGVVVAHNKAALKNRGSCIFLHIQKGKKRGTAGCTSMAKEDIQKIVHWLDKTKNPVLIQIPKEHAKEVVKLYPFLERSKLLK